MMVAREGLGGKLAVFVVAMLVTLGGWSLGAYAQVSTDLSPHFKCYVLTPAPSLNEPIRLGDQFHPIDSTGAGGESVVVRSPEFVCTPVTQKCRTDASGVEVCQALEQPLPPFDHLKCHNITPSGPPVNVAATVTDQFGPESLTVRTAQFLCAPATKTIP
jgi:hypothetical protein